MLINDRQRRFPRKDNHLMSGRVCCGAAWPAAAQTRDTINRLPNTIYLPDAAGRALGGQERRQEPVGVAGGDARSQGAAPNPAAISAQVQNFVAQNAKELGLEGNAAKLVVKGTRETLTGRYVNMEQRLDGIPIIDSQVQLTVSDQGAVQSVARNVVDVPAASVASVKKTAEIAQRPRKTSCGRT